MSLATIVIISLACSSGDDFVQGSQIPRSDVFNDPLPASMDDQFAKVTGGTMTISNSFQDTYTDLDGTESPINEAVFDSLYRYEDYNSDEAVELAASTDEDDAYRLALGNEETGDSENDTTVIDSFLMMKTEVTVEMFVDFLNSIAFKSDELTNAGEGETTSFTEAENIYKPIMQQEASCGIYRFEFGERANDEIIDFSGFFVSQKPGGQEYIDPFIELQKPRMASETQSSSFEVAPGRSKYPMVYVSQDEAKEFCRWLGAQYRLPTWQEWSWAGRAANLEYQFPTQDGNLFANGQKQANIQYTSAAPEGTARVGQRSPNPFGLFDMAGNVFEWTYFKAEDQSEGATIPYTNGKFLMGGSFKTIDVAFASTWFRFGMASSGVWSDDLGFRVIFDETRGNSISDAEFLFTE